MHKSFIALIISITLFTGCDTERIANIATPQEMANKDLIFIFPSMPKELCYADSVTASLDEMSKDLNGTNPQVIDIDHSVDCATYGFTICETTLIEDEFAPLTLITCTSQEDPRLCMNVLGEEYRDSEGEYFEDSCLLGLDAFNSL